MIFLPQRYSEFSKYYETPPSDQWGGGGGGGGGGTGTTGNNVYSSTALNWRQPRNSKSIPSTYYAADDSPTACIYTENWRDHDNEAIAGGAIATPHGTISLRLHNRIRVDMTIDRAVRVINFKVFLLFPSFSSH